MCPGIFSITGDRSITDEEHFGIKSFMLTTNVLYRDVLSFRGLWALPYASSDFLCEVRLCGEKVRPEGFEWNGNECRRWGRLNGLSVSSVLILPMEKRCGILRVTVENPGAEAVSVPVQLSIRGGVDYVTFWEFARPASSEESQPWSERATGWTVSASNGNLLLKDKDAGTIAVGTDLENPKWEVLSGHWSASLTIPAASASTIDIVVCIGKRSEARENCRAALESPGEMVASAHLRWSQETDLLFDRLPRLEAGDARLVNFYERSLVHFLLNQWRVSELALNPYYSTGGINGGCVCCYLWDFGEGWEVFPLYDPTALREHVKQFLSVDITRHFAFNPVEGEAFGPWYPVNQEKIIFLTYYYVLHTGDVSFLLEEVSGKTILDWMIYHAMYRDDLRMPVSLIDYGRGNNHLELRGTYRYDNYLPDLNARRYANYLAAHELSRLAGAPADYLPERAEALKPLIREMLWSSEHQWFFHLDENFNPALRYNVQIFKPLGSGILDEDQVEGLISHINEDEFLSAYGLHSMSKMDPAYDQVDIDNGGGGNYTAFTPQIIERLYKIGRVEMAEDLLNRILWWGERMPYWGDSIVANNLDYRRDTPLQNTIGSIAGAQCIIFGMFGVQVKPDGAIVVNPHPPAFSPEMSLTGLKIRQRDISIHVEGNAYRVTADGRTITSEVGTAVTLEAR